MLIAGFVICMALIFTLAWTSDHQFKRAEKQREVLEMRLRHLQHQLTNHLNRTKT